MDKWQSIETAPLDTAVLVYGFGYEVSHYNTKIGAWVTCSDHRKLTGIAAPKFWMPLREPPQ